MPHSRMERSVASRDQCSVRPYASMILFRTGNRTKSAKRVKLLLLYPPRAVAFWGTNADP